MREKILMVANTSWYLYNFRLPLARYLRDQGYEVVFVAPQDTYSKDLAAEGFHFIPLGMNRRSLNPLRELLTLISLWKIYRDEKPSVCHHFTIKCVLYGTIASKLAGVKAVVNAITGLGHAFIGNGRLHKIVRPFLRFVYRRILTARRVQVIFQNGDDFSEFQSRNMIIPEKATIIRGSGINLKRFMPRPGKLDGAPCPTVLLASRLIREKGVVEFVEAARQLRNRGLQARFCLAGRVDPGNPSSVSEEMLGEWCAEGAIDYLGHTDQIEDFLKVATLVTLPSYREGTPRILLEAAAMGKPIVTTDVPGCREVVKHGVSGLLVPARDPKALADAIENLITNREKMAEYGANARRLVQDFCEDSVIRRTEEIYRKAQGKSLVSAASA